MVDEKYGVAYSEILEILKYIPIEDYNKIPKDKIEIFETYANKEYTFEYDPNKTLKEQNVSNITKEIIILLFRDCWATEVQRNKIIAKQNYDRMKLEEKKKEKYNLDNILNKNQVINKITEKHSIEEENMDMVKYKQLKWYNQIFDKILNIFRKK